MGKSSRPPGTGAPGTPPIFPSPGGRVRVGTLEPRQTPLRGVEDELSPMPEVQLLIDVVHMAGDRLGRDGARTSDLLGAPATRDQDQDLALAQAEPGGGCGSRPYVLYRREHRSHEKRIQVNAGPAKARDRRLQRFPRHAARQVSRDPGPDGVGEYRRIVVGVKQEERSHTPG